MTTAYYSHRVFAEHLTGADHPECPDRYEAIDKTLSQAEFAALDRREAPLGTREQISLIHDQAYMDHVLALVPETGTAYVDPDTPLSPKSGEAVLRAVGAVCAAVDAVVSGEIGNAFCAVRPPGHHAERAQGMGFCVFNNVAVAALHARERHGLRRIAVIDFDVHHGNGTQHSFYDDPELFYGSTHQHPWYPGTGIDSTPNILNCPLPSGAGPEDFRRAIADQMIPALDGFRPDLVLISAGFDAHHADPLGEMHLTEADYAWVTHELLGVAERHSRGRLVSALEGGYNIEALAASVAAHVRTLLSCCHEPT